LHVRLNRQKLASSQTERGLRLFALLCILMMPLQFKGGAAESHPHAFFQFWSDAEAAPHHHGFDEDSGGDSHEQHEHEHPAAPIKRNLLAAQSDDPSSVETSVGPPGLIGIGQVAGIAMTLLLASLFVTSDLAFERSGSRASLDGQSVLPPVPPPRLPVRFAN
jgi:hypothetical protein